MQVFDFINPGSKLSLERRDIIDSIRSLKSSYFSANVALNMFQQYFRQNSVSSPKSLADFFSDLEVIDSTKDEVRSSARSSKTPRTEHEISLEAEIIIKRKKWLRGVVPVELINPGVIISAEAFIFALDTFEKDLEILEKECVGIIDLSRHQSKFKELFPNLKHIRDSAHHTGDRRRRLGRNEKPLKLGIEGSDDGTGILINRPLYISCLEGDTYVTTLNDGKVGEIEISPGSMLKLQYLLLEILKSFTWIGPPVHEPT